MTDESRDDTPRGSGRRKRTRMVRPYPIHALQEVLTIATTIQEANAGLAFDRVLLAGALGTTPASSSYTMKLNSSAKYGLTQGGYSDARISLTARGEAIVVPRGGIELHDALVEAAMEPHVFAQLYEMLDGKRLPDDTYAQNMLQRELGIHPDLTGECLSIIKANGLYVGIVTEASGSLNVNLREPAEPALHPEAGERKAETPQPVASEPHTRPDDGNGPVGRIFVGHGGDGEAVRFVLEVLNHFGVPYGTVETDLKDHHPVPRQVSSEMRNCTAAILVFAGQDITEEGEAMTAVDKVLYQLGAASVLYGDKVVILREIGFDLTPEVDGLPNVAFDGARPAEAGFGLLRELHKAGVLSVGTKAV